MKIQDISTKSLKSDIIEDDGKTRNQSLKFKDALDNEIDKVQKDTLKELISDIDNSALALKSELNIENLLSYKKKVKQFLHSAIENIYKRTKRETVDLGGRKKIFTIVEKINKKLEKLTEDFIKDNKKNVELLKMIDEIKGLLIDIYS